MRFFCNFQTLWGPINSCCMFFKLHSIFQSWVDVTKSHLFHSPKSRPRPLMSVRVREKNVRFRVGLGELDWFFSWDPQFSSICSVLRFTQFFWVAMARLKNPFWKVMKRALFDDHSEWFFLGKLFARKLVGTVFPLLLLISHTWRKLHCLTKAEKMDYSRAQVADDPSNFTTGFFV